MYYLVCIIGKERENSLLKQLVYTVLGWFESYDFREDNKIGMN